MIGLVEQLLTGKPAIPSQPAGSDEQQSPKEANEKRASFLSLLLQLFGGIVHPSVQKPEITLVSSEQEQDTTQGHVLPVPVKVEAFVKASPRATDSSSRILLSPPLPVPARPEEVTTELLPSQGAERQSFYNQPTEAATAPKESVQDVEPVDRTRHDSGDAPPSLSSLDDRVAENIPISRESVSENSKSGVPPQTRQTEKDSPITVPTPMSVDDEVSSVADQRQRQIPTNLSEEDRAIPTSEFVRVRGDGQPHSEPQPLHVADAAAQVQSGHADLRPSATAKSTADIWRADRGDRSPEAAEVLREAHKVEAGTHSTLPADWGKMKLTARGALPVHEFTPAETTVALKAVAESFSVGRIFTLQNEPPARMRQEVNPFPDTDGTPDVAQSAGDVPEPVVVEMNRKPAGARENLATADADNTGGESVPNWSIHRATMTEQAEQPLQAASSNHAVEGTEKTIVMHVQQPLTSTKVDGARVKDVPARTGGLTIELPEGFARDFVVRVADELRLHVAGRTSEVRVRLKPEHLGELSLKVTMQEGELAARLDVSVPAVKAALDAQLPQLREALASQGIEIRRFDVVADEQRNAHREQQRFQHQSQSGRQTDVDVTETYAAMRDLGYNTVEYII